LRAKPKGEGMKTAAKSNANPEKSNANPEPRPIPESVRAELAALAEMSDEDIDFSDIPETKDEDWVGAVRGKFYRPDTQFKFKGD
jgi:hypothetical protein